MTTLTVFVILYLAVSVAIGLFAARRVKTSGDYAVAGRSLPLYIVIATVFATWFGSETVLGIPAKFVKDGLRGVIEDPFGASMCLVLVGLFFARKLYRMNLLTIGDYYRQRYSRTVEVLVSLCIVASYLGWVSAQITALGLVFNVLSQGAVSMPVGMCIGSAIVLLYTLFGGMWSVALTDFFQMTIIVIGLLYIAYLVSGMAGGAQQVVAHAAAAGKFHIAPALTARELLAFAGALVTMMFGSIPQQDVFQRVMSARSEGVGAAGSLSGGALYFLFAFVPMFLAYSAYVIDPKMVDALIESDAQMILPTLILNNTPVFAQVMFFGALLSAIMSTASGTLLAPSITLTENVLREIFPMNDRQMLLAPSITLTENVLREIFPMNDRQMLLATRLVVVCFAVVVTIFALVSQGTPIYDMVGNAYKVTLVTAFVPLVMGLYWKGASNQGALCAVIGGLATWLLMERFGGDSIWPPQLAGLLASFAGMLLGSLLPQYTRATTGATVPR
ncbi:sodium:solute symporter family protein|uniref:sodium:solute symporter family protein n=1 Tax=Noviherbaspirillum sp. L7-7A TaxID=2850560 RepID=UPI001C2C3467|nr:sodium:solute symporter family protein [Noviherbaspirillum sp. L7-7A]MBV0880083.1 sodium:solute symporter family protein [Noviherbaspirillum sp. L7-7A]